MFLPLSWPVLASVAPEEVKIIDEYFDYASLDDSAGLIGINFMVPRAARTRVMAGQISILQWEI
jgi:hypothetical protein